MPFCSNCGSKLPEQAAFCSGCGARQQSPPQPAQSAQPVQPVQTAQPAQPQPPVYQQPAYQQPAYQQPAYYGYVPVKKKKPAGLIIGISAAAIVFIAAVVVGIILLAGGGGGLKGFDYDDITGYYYGSLTPGEYSLGGDVDEYAKLLDVSTDDIRQMIDENNEHKGDKLEARVRLYEDSIDIYCMEGVSLDLEIEDFTIGGNGVAKGTYEETDYDEIKYKVTLKADGDGYRLVGSVDYRGEMPFVYNGKSYSLELGGSFKFDVSTEN
jgi:hypothetical protein